MAWLGTADARVRRPASSYCTDALNRMLALAPNMALAARDSYSMSYGWSFQLASEPKPQNCTAATFPVDLTDKECMGLQQQLQVADQETCRETCCGDDTCTVWQWCQPGHDCSPANSCWTGNQDVVHGCKATQSGWASTGRAATPGPAPDAPKPGDVCGGAAWCSTTYDDSSWRGVTLPHDFVVEGAFTETADKAHGYLPFGKGYYRKRFDVPASAQGQHTRLDFEGAQTHSTVWLNGVCLGSHGSGYTPFGFELSAANVSKYVRFGGTNVLAVLVDTSGANKADGWWYDGGGLYRNAWLTVAPPLHVEQWGVYAPSVVTGAISSDATTAAATLHASIELVNDRGTDAPMTLTSVVCLGDVEVARKSSSAVVRGRATLNQTIDLGTARLWAPEHPALYTLTTTVAPTTSGGTVETAPAYRSSSSSSSAAAAAAAAAAAVDVVNTTFGVRTIRFDAARGFFLNGVATKIRGCANHQDIAGLGVAVPDALQAYRIGALQEFGANGWRTAHNQPSAALLDAADRLGMLVWDENHRNGQPHEVETLVRRDRNHPSIVIWSLCNEVLCESGDKNGDGRVAEGVIRRLDPIGTRPVSANNNGMNGEGTILDLQGFDYATGSYDEWHKAAPTIPAISSETSSAVGDRGEYANDRPGGHVTGYDTQAPGWGQTAEVAWSAILEKDFMSGGFTWTGWDYKGEPTPYAWPDINSHFGIIDVAGFWKDRTYWYSAYYKPHEPQAHVFPHWSWATDASSPDHLTKCAGMCRVAEDGQGAAVDMWVYTNGAEAELVVNNVSLGRKPVANFSHAEWDAVPFVPGRVEARAYEKVGDTAPMATDAVETVGPAAKLLLSGPVNLGNKLTGSEALPANGVDVAFLHASVVDAAGRLVPSAAHNVTFSVSGPGAVVGTGNGDPASHVPDHAATRPAYHGKVLGIVRADDTGKAAELTVTVTAVLGEAKTSASTTIKIDAGMAAPRL